MFWVRAWIDRWVNGGGGGGEVRMYRGCGWGRWLHSKVVIRKANSRLDMTYKGWKNEKTRVHICVADNVPFVSVRRPRHFPDGVEVEEGVRHDLSSRDFFVPDRHVYRRRMGRHHYRKPQLLGDKASETRFWFTVETNTKH